MKHLGRKLGAVGMCVFGLGIAGTAAGECGPGDGSCCIANGTPGCQDPICCAAVCAVDSFCCDNQWDFACISEAQDLCVECGGHPAWAIEVDGLGADERLVLYDPFAPASVIQIGPLAGMTATQFATGLAWTPDHQLWMTAVDINDFSSELHRLDPTTGGTLLEMPITGLAPGEQATDLAYNRFTHTMNLLTAQGNSGRVRELDLSTGNAVLVSPIFGGNYLGLAVTSDGHTYLENVASNAILHVDASYSLVNTLPLGFDAEFNQGLGADWSRTNTLALAALDASVPSTDGSVSYTFNPDLSGLTLHGVIGGAGTAQELGDVTFQPTCLLLGCDDGNDCTVEQCIANRCNAVPMSGPCEVDGNQCTIGSCFDGECVEIPANGLPCELDGSLCTVDACNGAGNCVTLGTVFCPGPAGCDGGQACNPASGQCEDLPDPPFLTVCEADGDLCTVDVCDGFGACIFLGDVQCGEGETCNPATGECEPDAEPCPWDCGDGDGIVGINDFLALLAEWDQVGAPCDFDGGGVGIVDFLKLLANWGLCP